jgi:hypothetical protein
MTYWTSFTDLFSAELYWEQTTQAVESSLFPCSALLSSRIFPDPHITPMVSMLFSFYIYWLQCLKISYIDVGLVFASKDGVTPLKLARPVILF